jgi:glycine C-acetyltransferase
MGATTFEDLERTLAEIREAGLYKEERVIAGPQGAEIKLEGGRRVINFCANNYLGLSSHPRLIAAAHRALDSHGYGMSSVRFICGTQDIHKQLEGTIARFLGVDDAILYAACFDANGGVFEPLLGEEDAIVSDELNHASIIDGIRLCKAQRWRYKNNDLADLERCLVEARAKNVRRILIATDGAFSMDGSIADLAGIVALAKRFDAWTMVDDCHATGFLGKTGRGSTEHCGVLGQIDIVTGTLGKALGGASGGFVAGRGQIVELLRQRSRPYLFSNTLMPSIVGASLEVFALLGETTALRDTLEQNTAWFRQRMAAAGFELKPGVHPIVPIMLYDEKKTHEFARRLLDEGIYVIGFSYPVVAKGLARIRVQVSAGHTREHLERAVAAFTKVGRELGGLKAASV